MTRKTLDVPTAERLRSSASHFRADIQGLRGLAVVAVVLGHVLAWPSGGFVGVDVFFVISGYLITGLLLREHRGTSRISFSGFYVRRARRILPAAALVLVATVAGSAIFLPAARALRTAVDAAWAAVFLENVRMQETGTDYFQLGRPPSALQHFWSLSVEEQFYFVWPWLLLTILLIVSRRSALARHGRTAAAVAMVIICVTSLGWSAYLSITSPASAYFSGPARIWELGVGALAAILTDGGPIIRSLAGRLILFWSGLLAILFAVFTASESSGVPFPGVVLPVFGAFAIVLAGSGASGNGYLRGSVPLVNPVARFVGDISYSLYLWHFPVFIIAAAMFAETTKTRLLVIAVSVLLAWLSYRFVERPIRASSWLSSFDRGRERSPVRRRNTLLTVTAALTVVLVVGASVTVIDTKSSADAVAAQHAASVLKTNQCAGAASMPASGEHCASLTGSGPITPPIDGFENDTGGAFGCYRGAKAPPKECSLGSARGDALRVALIGDSHAAMLLPGLEPQLKKLNWHLDVWVGNGCQWRYAPEADCGDMVAKAQESFLSSERPYDMIITTAARWTTDDTSQVRKSFTDEWQRVAKRGTMIAVIADNPGVTADALACVGRIQGVADRSACETSTREAFAHGDALADAGAILQRDTPNVRVVNLHSFFCVGHKCPAVIGNVIVYRDTAGHITATYSRSLAPYLVHALTSGMHALAAPNSRG